MQPTIESKSARDELFRRIGRNVLYFQYLEATLRAMIPGIYKKATLKELQANQHKVSRKRRTLFGKSANDYHNRVYGENIADEQLPDEGPVEPTVTFGFNIKVTPEKAAERKRALKKLIKERNRLVHQDLLNIDLNSREECEELSTKLDEQYTRIRRHLDHLNSVRTNLQEMSAEFARLLQSDEFLALLSGNSDNG